MKKFYEHKSHRLQNYNYSSNGSYFITICTKNKECLLGDITVADDTVSDLQTDNINDSIYHKSINAKIILSDYGKTTYKYIESSKTAYENLAVDNYVIMPNHIHLIISVSSAQQTLSSSPQHALIPHYVATLKLLITRETGFSLFQRNYHDHIIRNEKEYEKIWDYIDTNVSNWVADRFYMY
mgnify:CR=1 FL=1